MGRLSDSFSLSASKDAAPGPAFDTPTLPAACRTYWHSIAQIGVQVAGGRSTPMTRGSCTATSSRPICCSTCAAQCG